MKLRKTSSSVKMSTLSMKEDDNLLLKMQGTTMHSGAIINGSCVAGGQSGAPVSAHSGGCQQALPQLGGTLPGNPSLPPWIRPPSYGGWRIIAEPLEHRTPP
jgi:hypothetical protein